MNPSVRIWHEVDKDTHLLHEPQDSMCRNSVQTIRPGLQPLTHSFWEKNTQLFSPHMLQHLFCSIYSFLHLFWICIQQGEIKVRWERTSSKHLWWLYGTWKNIIGIPDRLKMVFCSPSLVVSRFCLIFFALFPFFIPSVWEQGRRGGSVLKRKSSLLCGRSHRLRLADGMTGQSRYPERVSYHGNCCNFTALRVIAFASAAWCDSREMSVWGVSFFFQSYSR